MASMSNRCRLLIPFLILSSFVLVYFVIRDHLSFESSLDAIKSALKIYNAQHGAMDLIEETDYKEDNLLLREVKINQGRKLVRNLIEAKVDKEDEMLVRTIRDYFIERPRPFLTKFSLPLFKTDQAKAVDNLLDKVSYASMYFKHHHLSDELNTPDLV